jgi:hypothetical protein
MFILALFAPYFVAVFARSYRLRIQIAPCLSQESFKIFQKKQIQNKLLLLTVSVINNFIFKFSKLLKKQLKTDKQPKPAIFFQTIISIQMYF